MSAARAETGASEGGAPEKEKTEEGSGARKGRIRKRPRERKRGGGLFRGDILSKYNARGPIWRVFFNTPTKAPAMGLVRFVLGFFRLGHGVPPYHLHPRARYTTFLKFLALVWAARSLYFQA